MHRIGNYPGFRRLNILVYSSKGRENRKVKITAKVSEW
jgi:hypothetical protein